MSEATRAGARSGVPSSGTRVEAPSSGALSGTHASGTRSARSGGRWRAAATAFAPVGLVAASLAHPHIAGRLPNDAAIAAAVAAGPTRWAVAHLAAGLASAFVVLAFLAVHGHLREAGEARWSGPALSFVVLGSTLYAILPGMEFAPYAAVETGVDAEAIQGAVGPWFLPVLLSGALAFALGAAGFAADVARAGIPGPRAGGVVAAALLVMAASRVVPFAAVQFHVQGAAALVAFWPLARVMWKGSSASAVGAATSP